MSHSTPETPTKVAERAPWRRGRDRREWPWVFWSIGFHAVLVVVLLLTPARDLLLGETEPEPEERLPVMQAEQVEQVVDVLRDRAEEDMLAKLDEMEWIEQDLEAFLQQQLDMLREIQADPAETALAEMEKALEAQTESLRLTTAIRAEQERLAKSPSDEERQETLEMIAQMRLSAQASQDAARTAQTAAEEALKKADKPREQTEAEQDLADLKDQRQKAVRRAKELAKRLEEAQAKDAIYQAARTKVDEANKATDQAKRQVSNAERELSRAKPEQKANAQTRLDASRQALQQAEARRADLQAKLEAITDRPDLRPLAEDASVAAQVIERLDEEIAETETLVAEVRAKSKDRAPTIAEVRDLQAKATQQQTDAESAWVQAGQETSKLAQAVQRQESARETQEAARDRLQKQIAAETERKLRELAAQLMAAETKVVENQAKALEAQQRAEQLQTQVTDASTPEQRQTVKDAQQTAEQAQLAARDAQLELSKAHWEAIRAVEARGDNDSPAADAIRRAHEQQQKANEAQDAANRAQDTARNAETDVDARLTSQARAADDLQRRRERTEGHVKNVADRRRDLDNARKRLSDFEAAQANRQEQKRQADAEIEANRASEAASRQTEKEADKAVKRASDAETRAHQVEREAVQNVRHAATAKKQADEKVRREKDADKKAAAERAAKEAADRLAQAERSRKDAEAAVAKARTNASQAKKDLDAARAATRKAETDIMNAERTSKRLHDEITREERRRDRYRKDIERDQGRLKSAETQLAESREKQDDLQARKNAEDAARTRELARATTTQVEAETKQVEAIEAQNEALEAKAQAEQAIVAMLEDKQFEAEKETTDETRPEAPRDLAALYRQAVETERRITETYRQVKASETAILREVPLAEAISETVVPITERPGLNEELLRRRARTTQAAAEYKAESRKAETQANEMVAAAEQLHQMAAMIAGKYREGETDREGQGLTSLTLAKVQAEREQVQQREQMAMEDEGQRYKDLTGRTGGGDDSDTQGKQDPGRPSREPSTPQGPSREMPAIAATRFARVGTGRQQTAPWAYVDTWYTIGPFPNPDRRNIDTHFPPQSVVDLDARYIGKNNRTVRWEFIKTHSPMVRPANEQDYGIYYAYTELWFDEPTEALIAVGSDDNSRLWINGQPAWKSGRKLKAWNPTEGYRRLVFQKGINKVLYRVENGWHVCMFSLLIDLKDR